MGKYLTKYNLIYLFPFVVFVITAYNSVGFYHADEHFQILEFAMYKLNGAEHAGLPWEFFEQIRPTLQPTIAYGMIKLLQFAGINDPYHWAFVLRLLTAVLAFFLIKSFAEETSKSCEDSKKKQVYILASFLLWFVPFISVRFSSETWSGLFFFWAVLAYLRKEMRQPLVLGLLLGMSFLFRFQIAFAILGFGLWVLIVRKDSFLSVVKMALGFFVILGLGALLDTWFYGNFVFTPWNYFYSNIVEDVASSFGTSPIDFYFSRTLFEPTLPIGLLISVSMIFLLVKNWKSMYLWIIIPYLFFHSIVPHKEYRFMFPMVYFVVPLVWEAYGYLKKRKWSFYPKIGLALLLMVNFVALAVVMIKPAGIGYIEIAKFIHKEYSDKQVSVMGTKWGNPLLYGGDLTSVLYESDNVENYLLESLEDLDLMMIDSVKVNLYATTVFMGEIEEVDSILTNQDYTLVKSGEPLWLYQIRNRYRRVQDTGVILLYEYSEELK